MILEQYERGITGNFMILNSETNSNVGYELRMINENNIPSFLDTKIRYVNGMRQYVYDISSLVSIYHLYEHSEMSRRDLTGLLSGLSTGLQSLSDYLLPDNNIVLDPKYIYMNVETKKVYLCYLPGYEVSLSQSMTLLAEYILKKVDHTDEEGTRIAYEIYKNILNEDYALKRYIDCDGIRDQKKDVEVKDRLSGDSDENMMKEAISPIEYEDYYDSEEGVDKTTVHRKHKVMEKIVLILCGTIIVLILSILLIARVYKPYRLLKYLLLNEVRLFLCITGALAIAVSLCMVINRLIKIKGKQVDNSGINMELDNSFYREINNIGQIGMTSKLIVDSMKYRLVQFGNEYLNEIVIEKAPFVIGKKPELCDGIIDNSAVSRVHAKLLLEDGGVYLMDMNSRNGTYVNGYRITGGEKVRLNQNDEVRFANDLFYFR